jgi:hypothetical protein
MKRRNRFTREHDVASLNTTTFSKYYFSKKNMYLPLRYQYPVGHLTSFNATRSKYVTIRTEQIHLCKANSRLAGK